MGINQINSRSENLKAREVMVKLCLVLIYARYDSAVAPPSEAGRLKSKSAVLRSRCSMWPDARNKIADHHVVLAFRGNEAICPIRISLRG